MGNALIHLQAKPASTNVDMHFAQVIKALCRIDIAEIPEVYMKSFMMLLLLLAPLSSHAVFGMLGRDQCSAPITAFPTNASDNNQSRNIQIQELENNRKKLDSQMIQVNAEMGKFQGYIKLYFSASIDAPWADTMLAHMDNGHDCCSPDRQANVSAQYKAGRFGTRSPAGNEDFTEVTAPQEDIQLNVDDGSQGVPDPVVSVEVNSCGGFSKNFCSSDWSKNSQGPPAGAAPVCLQTGFTNTPAWYFGACRNAGEIDPQVCSDPRIAKMPNDFKNCTLTLDAYRKLAAQKRQLSANIATSNQQILVLKYPNRPSSFTGGGSTETTNGENFLSSLGGVLGSVAQLVLPSLIQQFLPQQNQNPNMYRNQSGPPAGATYYGPNYGYPFSNNGVQGGQPSGMQTGGFACSGGSFGGGLSLIANLLGGFGGGGSSNLNFNAGGGLGSIFGSLGGIIPSIAASFMYGNQQPNTQSFRFGGFNPPYLQGGIYGAKSGPPAGATRYSAGGNGSVPNFLSGNAAFPQNNFNLSGLLGGLGNLNLPSGNLLGGQNTTTIGLNAGGYQNTPYFGNMSGILSTLFNPHASVNFNANASFGL